MSTKPQLEPREAPRYRYLGKALSILPGVAFRAQRRGSTHMIGVRRLRSIFDEDVRCVKGGPFGFYRTSTLRRTLRQNPIGGPLDLVFQQSVLPDEIALATMTGATPMRRSWT